MNFLALIEAKRDGQALNPGQIQSIISACTSGAIPDYQLSAFLMAVYCRGLTTQETRALTIAMRDSGDVLRFPRDRRPIVDKHSTGGVGDKVSLPLAPLLACLGFRVPMISGRGLGITGGTLDKLDSIPGFQTLLPAARIKSIVQRVGCVICGQTERMVPADKRIYALRDVTGTVPSIPLIVASILSKKLAEGLDALVLDVKFGAAAFMSNLTQARELARAMVTLGNECGVNTRALLTNMDAPLGRAAGNWLEVKESVECLEASAEDSPLRKIVIACAAHLLVQAGKSKSLATATAAAEDCLDSGAPRKKWDEMIAAQGADLAATKRKLALDHTAQIVVELKTTRGGWVSKCDARIIGEVIRDLGGGRLTKESRINPDVGVDRIVSIGEKIAPGGLLCRLHAANAPQARAEKPRLLRAFEVSSRPPKPSALIREVIAR